MTLIGATALLIAIVCLAAAIHALGDEQRMESFRALAQPRVQDINA